MVASDKYFVPDTVEVPNKGQRKSEFCTAFLEFGIYVKKIQWFEPDLKIGRLGRLGT